MSLGQTIKSIKKAQTLLVTPKVEEFLRAHPEGVIWDEDGYALFKELTKAAFGTNSDRSGRFGASARGKCHRYQMWQFLGMPERRVLDPEKLNMFNDGKWRHIRWQMMAMQSGAVTHVEYPLSLPKYRLKSSADGLNSIDTFLFELKGDRHMARLLDTPGGVVYEHDLQVHAMFLMTGWDLASYVMEDKATQQWREVIIRRDPNTIRIVKQELEELNQHVEDRTLPAPLPACQAKEGPYRTCPFAKPCVERWHGGRGGDYWPDTPGDWDT